MTRPKSSAVVLAQGTAPGFTAGSWHKISLGFKGLEITAYLDGKELARLQDDSRKNGMAYLATSYDPNNFDNVAVVAPPVDPRPAARGDRGGSSLGE